MEDGNAIARRLSAATIDGMSEPPAGEASASPPNGTPTPTPTRRQSFRPVPPTPTREHSGRSIAPLTNSVAVPVGEGDLHGYRGSVCSLFSRAPRISGQSSRASSTAQNGGT